MVYMDISHLTWHSIKLRWILEKEIEGYEDNLLNVLEDLFDKWVEPILLKKREIVKERISKIDESAQLNNFCILIECFLEKILKK